MKRCIVLVLLVMTAADNNAENVNYSLLAERARIVAQKMADYGGKFSVLSEEMEKNADSEDLFSRTMYAWNNADAIQREVKNLKDLLSLCASAQRIKTDLDVNKEINTYCHSIMRTLLDDIQKRMAWAEEQVSRDTRTGETNALTKLQRNYTTTCREYDDFFNSVADIIFPERKKVVPVLEKQTAPPRIEVKTTVSKTPDQEIMPTLEGAEATVYIFSIPPNANVFMDGKFIGKTNKDKLPVTPGIHKMHFVAEGKTLHQEMTFAPGDNAKRFVTIK